MRFQDAFPERQARPPTMAGERPRAPTVLNQLRRRQLVDLARAYEIEINPDDTKNRLLPVLQAAENAGVFKQPAKHEAYLIRASIGPDDPLPPEGLPDTPSLKETEKSRKKDMPPLMWLKSECKRHGINSYGMDQEAMLRALLEREQEKKRAGADSAEGTVIKGEGVSGQHGPVGDDPADVVAESSS